MIIDRIDTVRVDEFPNLLFVEVHTDEGACGLGETFFGARTVEAHVHETVAPRLLGRDPLRIERIGAELAGYVGYAGTGAETRARSAVDVALWDILGQAAGRPLYDLLGGRTRERIRVYNTCAGSRYVRGDAGQSVQNWGAEGPGRYEDLYAFLHHADRLAEELLASGITGMKVWPFDPYAEASDGTYIAPEELDRGLEPLRRIRSAVGDAMDVMVELHGLWDVRAARQILRALEPYQPFWVEDPVRPDLVGGLSRLCRDSAVTVAAGETVAGRNGFLPLLTELGPGGGGRGAGLGVVTADVTWSGGLSEARKIAAVAESFGVPVAPHDCTGPVALTACTHLSVSAPNALVQEFVRAAYYGWYPELVTDLPEVRDGTITPPSGPGLGTRLRPDLRDRPDVQVRTASVARDPR